MLGGEHLSNRVPYGIPLYTTKKQRKLALARYYYLASFSGLPHLKCFDLLQYRKHRLIPRPSPPSCLQYAKAERESLVHFITCMTSMSSQYHLPQCRVTSLVLCSQ